MQKVNNIFEELTIDRSKVRWEDYLDHLTPIEEVSGLTVKREDYFAPLGYGGINGSKLRQAIWLVNNYVKKGGSGTIMSGASIKSPQLPMVTAVGLHYGLKSKHVIGATKPETAIKHENVKMAKWFGAEFEILKVGYNPVLQNGVKAILGADDYYLNYGITPGCDASVYDILGFHLLGANQVANIPDYIEDIVLPAGSCNSAISVLMGLMVNRPVSLKNIYLIGIGPDKMKFINDRLNLLSKIIGVNVLNFKMNFGSNDLISYPESNYYNLHYYNLHKEGFTDYQKEMKFTIGGVELHPTYEGKVMSYIVTNLYHLYKRTTLFWIVGSKPRIEPMLFLKEELGEVPAKLS